MSNKKTCFICTEDRRNFIRCDFCKYEACRSCYETYFIHTQEAMCMSCKNVWNISMIYNNFDLSYIKKYKEKREELLYVKECALIPETQEQAVRVKTIEEMKENIEKYRSKIQKYLTRNDTSKMDKYKKKCRELRAKLNNLLYGDERHEEIKEKRIIKEKCMKEDCKGYLLNEYCDLCKHYTCKGCLKVLEDKKEHKCNKDDVESVKLLKKETRPCPNCNISVSKVDGCDQMWCVNCKTAFYWSSLKIVQKGSKIHNPHYYEYLRKNQGEVPRDPDDVKENECVVPRLFGYNEFNIKEQLFDNILNLYNGSIYSSLEYIPREKNTLNDRIRFILNRIDEKHFKSRIYAVEKHNSKIEEFRAFYTMCVNGVFEMLYQLRNTKKTKNDIKKFYKEFGYFMEKIVYKKHEELCKIYGCKWKLGEDIYRMYIKPHIL